MGDIWFVTGGARSGKSRAAERRALASGAPVTYIATLEPLDEEMRDRIARHRADRPETWQTVEAPRDLARPVQGVERDRTLLVDCLSVWVANRLLMLGSDAPTPAALLDLERALDDEIASILDACAQRDGRSILVTNEVGSGLVPPYPLGRAYRDLLGRVNQQVSARATRAWLVVAGRAIELPPADVD